ncbi:MAG: hypothetical protein WCC86_08775 [Methanoregula sp.]|uniref:hypothetical protein n=1 Tax=Methanoregula sp. TaxID=2052170 RepID=UPI003BB1100B
MRILKSIQSKVCVDGSLMKEYLLDEPLTTEFLGFLEDFGTVRSFSHLRRPYFSFEKDRFISIKGFVGDTNVEVRYKREFADLTADFFHLLLYYYRQGPAGRATLEGIITSISVKMDARQGIAKASRD